VEHPKGNTMTPEQLKQLLPIVMAYIDGKEIEVKRKFEDMWVGGCKDLVFNQQPDCYRIKSEPEYRPWTLEEVVKLPIDAIFIDSENAYRYIIYNAEAGDEFTYVDLTNKIFTRETDTLQLLKTYAYSLDHGVTWNKCGVLVEEI
jgi:hypothetical protein